MPNTPCRCPVPPDRDHIDVTILCGKKAVYYAGMMCPPCVDNSTKLLQKNNTTLKPWQREVVQKALDKHYERYKEFKAQKKKDKAYLENGDNRK
jgi:hypothetical protein